MKKASFAIAFLFIISGGFCQVISSVNSIEKTNNPEGWIIHTKSTVYQISINEQMK